MNADLEFGRRFLRKARSRRDKLPQSPPIIERAATHQRSSHFISSDLSPSSMTL